jgi:hypothetical protein
LSYLTGAGPGTTGVFYDDSYSRTLLAPGSNSNATPGTEVTYFEVIDKNPALISGGGNFDASSIDPSLLPIDPTTNQVVYPNQFLQTNTVFDVAHNAGLYTAFSDKHPAYQIVNGPDPRAVNDFYGPEINSTTALQINGTNRTINANTLLDSSAPAVTGLTVNPSFNVTTFAKAPAGVTQPDSITVDGLNVYVGYNNGAAKDGSKGSSTIVQYDTAGNVIHTFTVAGHNDGLKVDPSTHQLWALQNEDANPTLVIIDPVAGTLTPYAISSVNGGGGFDDIAFLNGNVYFTASNPSLNPNTDPAVVRVTLNNTTHTASTTPILLGNALALNTVTNTQVQLNLQDPDSMTTDKSGDLHDARHLRDAPARLHLGGQCQQQVQAGRTRWLLVGRYPHCPDPQRRGHRREPARNNAKRDGAHHPNCRDRLGRVGPESQFAYRRSERTHESAPRHGDSGFRSEAPQTGGYETCPIGRVEQLLRQFARRVDSLGR